MDTIADVIRKIKLSAVRGVDETFVLPVLASLGWDVRNTSQVRLKSVGAQAQYLSLSTAGRLNALIHRIPLGQKLAGNAQRLLRDCSAIGACVAALTNGSEWWFFVPEDGKWPPVPAKVADLMSRDEVLVRRVLKEFLSPESALYLSMSQPMQPRQHAPLAETPAKRDGMPKRGKRPPIRTKKQLGPLVKGVYPPKHSVPDRVVLDGDPIVVSHWNELLVTTAEWLIAKKLPLPYDRVRPGARWTLVSRDQHALANRPVTLSNGAYIETDYSAPSCASEAHWLMKCAGYPKDAFAVWYYEPA